MLVFKMNWLIDPAKKATSRIMGVHHGHDTSGGSESSPLVHTRSAPPPDATSSSATSQHSKLSFSHEYQPFERSRKALVICMFHVAVYFGVAVVAFGYGFEKWGFVDSIYYAVVIFTTIGA